MGYPRRLMPNCNCLNPDGQDARMHRMAFILESRFILYSGRPLFKRYTYESGVRIENICDVLNHHSTRITEICIDITLADIEASMQRLEI
jgi:hypothetical protein